MRLAVSGAQPLFTLGLLMFALSLVDFLSLLLSPSIYFKIFLFLSKVSFEGHIQNLQKMSCWLKIWMGFVGPTLIKLWTSSIWGFLQLPLLWWTLGNCLCKHAGHHSVTTGACSPPHLTCLGLCSMAAWKLNGSICAMLSAVIWQLPIQQMMNISSKW